MTESDREEQKMKVVKFGGSSMADAGQYRKVRDILLADPERRVVVVSAAGKRFGNDHKLTDLLYLCYAHVQYGVDCSSIFDMIASRYLDIRDELGLDLALEPELDALKKRIDAKEVTLDGNLLHVTPLEYQLLELLFHNIGKVITTRTLLDELYGVSYGDNTQSLRALMAGLRRKIEKVPGKPQYIVTEIGVGYRLKDE